MKKINTLYSRELKLKDKKFIKDNTIELYDRTYETLHKDMQSESKPVINDQTLVNQQTLLNDTLIREQDHESNLKSALKEEWFASPNARAHQPKTGRDSKRRHYAFNSPYILEVDMRQQEFGACAQKLTY